MLEISVLEAAGLLEDNPSEVILLDVREDAELRTASVSSALHIPMGQIPDRLAELDKTYTILCMCHAGGRSAQVARFLADQGYDKICNVTGGIDAWSLQVAPQIPRY
jgi:rhodanese-related sulfurtransferase